MNGEMIYVLSVMAVAGMLFASGKVRLDIVALLVVLSLVLGGTLTPTEAFAGFGEPIVILVAGLLVISDMLARAGYHKPKCFALAHAAGLRRHRQRDAHPHRHDLEPSRFCRIGASWI